MTESPHFLRLPLTAQTVYAELLSRLQDDAVLELEGTPVLRARGGRKYWYAVQRLADRTVERYLGPDTWPVQARVERARAVNEDMRRRRSQHGRLVRMCRAAGMQRVDTQTGKVPSALSKAGMFRLRGVLVGTHAFRCCPALLGVEMPEAGAATGDIASPRPTRSPSPWTTVSTPRSRRSWSGSAPSSPALIPTGGRRHGTTPTAVSASNCSPPAGGRTGANR